jgi:hypothetical protein
MKPHDEHAPERNPSKQGFEEHLRQFKPRRPELDLESIQNRCWLEKNAVTGSPLAGANDLSIIPVASAIPQRTTSWASLSIAWSGGMVIGAALMFLFLWKFQSGRLEQMPSDAMVQLKSFAAPEDKNPSQETAKSNIPSPSIQFVGPESSNQAQPHASSASVPPDRIAESIIQTDQREYYSIAFQGRLRTSLTDDRQAAIMDWPLPDRFNDSPSKQNGSKEATIPDFTMDIQFVPPKSESNRQSLLQELLNESIL